MKKKIIALCLVVILALTAIGGATLAYFTDTDQATNTFTVGKVTIDLIEQQRKEDEDGKKTTELEDFKNGKLFPIVGSAQGDKDDLGMPVAANYVDKMITVKNTGSEDAWVRVYFAIPSILDDGVETFNAGLNILHFNAGSYKDTDGNWKSTRNVKWLRNHGDDNKWNYYETTIDGIEYNVYYGDYYQPLAANATTERFVDGVYLDKTFDYEYIDNKDGTTTEKPYVMQDNEKKYITLPEGWKWNEVKCPVFAVAVQAAGFSSAKEAVEAAFGTNYNPWGGTSSNWQ